MTDRTAEIPPAARHFSTVQAGWRTARTSLRVLAVVHSVAAATRITDVLPVFHDPRVQLFCAQTSGAVFAAGVAEYLQESGFLWLTWDEALSIEFDVVVTASLGDNLGEINSPILRLPHGNGYNKFWEPGTRNPEPGTRNPEPGTRNPEPGTRNPEPAFGLSEDTLTHDGRIVPSAIALSHTEQFDRLAEGCPEAVPRAFLAGDPCYDRLLASRPRRLNYRRAFQLRPGQRLITVNSTWREESLFGLDPALITRLLTELPYDEFRIALVLHPNAWASHSRLQIEAWLFDALRAGLVLVPPHEGWRAAVVAADWVLADHGSVGMYAAAVGRPVLLEKSGRTAVHPGSGLGRLFDVAPTLDLHTEIRPQLRHAEELRERTHALARSWVSSAPGQSLELIREAAYRVIGAPAPETEPPLLAVPEPHVEDTAPTSLWTRVRPLGHGSTPGELAVHRTPATVSEAPATGSADPAVLIASDGELDHRISAMADVIRVRTEDLPADEATWSAAVFEHRPGLRLTLVHDTQRGRLRTRDGRTTSVVLDPDADTDADPVAHSPVHAADTDAELVFAVLAERVATDAHPLDDLGALSPLRVRVSAERTVTAVFGASGD